MPKAMSASGGVAARIFKRALASSLKTSWLIIRLMVPVSLAVAALEWLGALRYLGAALDPAMKFFGLPGEASIVLLSSVFLNIYSAIAAAGALGLGGRAMVVLAIMCLTAHNLPVETAIMRKTGSSALKMVFLRLGFMVLAGFAFNLVLPRVPAARDGSALPTAAIAADAANAMFSPDAPDAESAPDAAEQSAVAAAPPRAAVAREAPLEALRGWAVDTGFLILKMIALISLIMLLQKVLDEFGFMAALSRFLSPLLRVFGLPPGTSVLWIVIQTVGYGYGAAVLMDQVSEGKVSQRDGDLLNHHAAVCHSLLEDTLLFAAVGVPILWITLPRLALALAVVWLERWRRFLFKRSFQVGTV
jgi:spore maturation protein SpmB